MADNSKIEWTDATWQIITGCSVVSPGCTNCYAMRLAGTRLRHHESRAGLTRETKAGPVWTGEVRFNEHWLLQPLEWTRPRQIFVCAHGDLFAEGVQDEWLDAIFAVMALCPQHTFQVLTKRPQRMLEYLSRAAGGGKQDIRNHLVWEATPAVMNLWAPAWKSEGVNGKHRRRAIAALGQWPLPNVWLGTSVEDQKRADDRVQPMRELGSVGWLTWVSYEPALGPVEWSGWEHLSWLVSGGESGPSARPSHPDWHRVARDFCATHEIAYHFKQWGAFVPQYDANIDPSYWASEPGDFADHAVDGGWCFGRRDGQRPWMMFKRHKKAAGRLLDGVEHNGFPKVPA